MAWSAASVQGRQTEPGELAEDQLGVETGNSHRRNKEKRRFRKGLPVSFKCGREKELIIQYGIKLVNTTVFVQIQFLEKLHIIS